MKKHMYCCEASRQLFEQYYGAQQQNGGASMPIYVGTARQRGHGLGSILSSLFRRFLPFLGRAAAATLRTGAQVADDVTAGQNFKDSLKTRVPSAINTFVSSLVPQKGSGIRKRKTRRKYKGGKRRRRDIFS